MFRFKSGKCFLHADSVVNSWISIRSKNHCKGICEISKKCVYWNYIQTRGHDLPGFCLLIKKPEHFTNDCRFRECTCGVGTDTNRYQAINVIHSRHELKTRICYIVSNFGPFFRNLTYSRRKPGHYKSGIFKFISYPLD